KLVSCARPQSGGQCRFDQSYPWNVLTTGKVACRVSLARLATCRDCCSWVNKAYRNRRWAAVASSTAGPSTDLVNGSPRASSSTSAGVGGGDVSAGRPLRLPTAAPWTAWAVAGLVSTTVCEVVFMLLLR